MENLKIQENLEENIKKVFEKLREEGLKGVKTDENSYPIEVDVKYKIIGGIREVFKNEIVGKDYNDYMKLIQVLERLLAVYLNYAICSIEGAKNFKEELLNELEYLQNTINNSLDRNYIKQYSCLMKCYESLLKNLRYFN